MSLGSLDAQIERSRDFLTGFAFGQQLDHFAFAGSQHVSCNILCRVHFSWSEVMGLVTIEKPAQNHLADPGGEKGSLVLYGFDGGDQIAGSVRFDQESTRPRAAPS